MFQFKAGLLIIHYIQTQLDDYCRINGALLFFN